MFFFWGGRGYTIRPSPPKKKNTKKKLMLKFMLRTRRNRKLRFDLFSDPMQLRYVRQYSSQVKVDFLCFYRVSPGSMESWIFFILKKKKKNLRGGGNDGGWRGVGGR